MSLRKNQPVKFARPISSMKTVYQCIEQKGPLTRNEIIRETGMVVAKGQAAIWNLVFVGALQRCEDSEGRTVYALPGSWLNPTADILKGVNSIFNVPLPK